MDLEKKFQMIINDADLKLEEDSAFEKLLKVLVDYGMDEEKAAQMIADCIDEQYELDNIRGQFSGIYQEAKNQLEPTDALAELHNQLLKSGMDDTDADMLAAKFLEQEAQTYVDCMKLVESSAQKKSTVLH